MTDVANAHKAILAAEEKIAEAERARDEASASLERGPGRARLAADVGCASTLTCYPYRGGATPFPRRRPASTKGGSGMSPIPTSGADRSPRATR